MHNLSWKHWGYFQLVSDEDSLKSTESTAKLCQLKTVHHCFKDEYTLSFFDSMILIFAIKSVHFKKTVAQSSFLSKVLSFSLTLFWFQQKWQHFWKKWGLRNCLLKMKGLKVSKGISYSISLIIMNKNLSVKIYYVNKKVSNEIA